MSQAALVVIPCTIFPFLAWIVWMIQPYMAAVSFSRESGASLWGVYNLQNSPTPEIAHLSAIAHTSSANWQELDNPEDAETWYRFADDFEASRLKQAINDFHSKTHSAASIAPYSIWTSSFPLWTSPRTRYINCSCHSIRSTSTAIEFRFCPSSGRRLGHRHPQYG